MTIALTDRDLELLGFIGLYKVAPLDVLAQHFFAYAFDSDDEPVKNPERACTKRLLELQRAGYVATKVIRGQTAGAKSRAVYLTPTAALVVNAPRPRPLPVRGRAHHMATLRAIEVLRAELARDGARITKVALEFQQRQQIQAGRATRRGETFDNFADAVVVIARGSDASDTEEVAVEYVTSKYTDRDIIDKAESFKRFDRSVFFADSQRTAARVARLTGAACRVL